jgi:hypothetical protein
MEGGHRMAIIIQHRNDTASNWTAVNPILAQGEIGIETDTRLQKVGDGILPWNSLEYYTYGGNSESMLTGGYVGTGATLNTMIMANDTNINLKVNTKLDKGNYTGTAQQLKAELDSLALTGNVNPQAITETGEANKIPRINSSGQLVADIVSPTNTSIMGVRFVDNGSSFTATRYGASIGKTYALATAGTVNTINSDFDTMPVFRLIRRCIVNKEDVIVAFQGDATYEDTLTLHGYAPHTHRVMVYIPKFYKRVNVSYEPNHVVDIAISELPFTGATIDPIFRQVDLDGSLVERPYILVSAFEGIAVNKDTGAYLFADRADATTRVNADFQLGTPSGLTTYANYLLTSINKQNAQAPTTNATLSDNRLMVQNWNLGKTSKKATTQFQYYAQVMLNHLFMIEFASTNWQAILSAGVTNLASGSFNESVSTGYTSILGNKSGYITGIVRGTLGTTQVPSYRGIENPFGNVWKFAEGLRKLSTGLGNEAKYGIYDITKTNNYSNFVANDFREQEHLLNLPTTIQYFRYRNDKLIVNRTEIGTNYYNDVNYSSVNSNIIVISGQYNRGVFEGGFSSTFYDFVIINQIIGARLVSC